MTLKDIKQQKEDWICTQIKIGGDSKVIQYIADIIFAQAEKDPDTVSNSKSSIKEFFAEFGSYCFAKILEDKFPGGKMCVCYPTRNIAYVYNGAGYQVSGIAKDPCNRCIPIEYLGEYTEEFKNISVSNCDSTGYLIKVNELIACGAYISTRDASRVAKNLKHAKGNYYIDGGTIYNSQNHKFKLPENMVILINTVNGKVVTVCSKQEIDDHYNNLYNGLISSGIDSETAAYTVISIKMIYEEISFASNGNELTIDEVCTLLNYLDQHVATEQLQEIFSIPIEDMMYELNILQGFGF